MSDELPKIHIVSGKDLYMQAFPSVQSEPRKTEFRQALEDLINRHSMENGSNTPDFVLADFLAGCLALFDTATNARDKWYRPKK